MHLGPWDQDRSGLQQGIQEGIRNEVDDLLLTPFSFFPPFLSPCPLSWILILIVIAIFMFGRPSCSFLPIPPALLFTCPSENKTFILTFIDYHSFSFDRRQPGLHLFERLACSILSHSPFPTRPVKVIHNLTLEQTPSKCHTYSYSSYPSISLDTLRSKTYLRRKRHLYNVVMRIRYYGLGTPRPWSTVHGPTCRVGRVSWIA